LKSRQVEDIIDPVIKSVANRFKDNSEPQWGSWALGANIPKQTYEFGYDSLIPKKRAEEYYEKERIDNLNKSKFKAGFDAYKLPTMIIENDIVNDIANIRFGMFGAKQSETIINPIRNPPRKMRNDINNMTQLDFIQGKLQLGKKRYNPLYEY